MAERTTTQQQTTTRCLRCGRALTAARSIANNYGPTCRRRVRDAARAEITAQYKPHQVDKARELIEDGALVAIRPNIFRVVSSDGAEVYTAHRAGCTCPAATKGRGRHACKHRIAAHLLAAA